MIHLLRTDSQNEDFIRLVNALDADLAKRDGEEHEYYDQFNKIDNIKHTVVAYHDEHPIGCGAIKKFDEQSMEVKRMFVLADFRGKGVADQILNELEKWASELSALRCVLETGKRQHEAVRFYQRSGYKPISNYGQYIGVENSLCFEKKLRGA